MRYLIFLLSIICFVIPSYAESFNQYNSASRTAIVLYTPDAQGFYHKQTNVSVNNVNNIEAQYAFDKKNKKLYVATEYGNYVVELTDSKAKLVKKDKSIPQVKEKDIDALVLSVNNSLETKFAQYNLQREQFITDSIENDREQARLAAIEKARLDSIEQANKQAEINRYRAAHDWHWLPIKKKSRYTYSSSTETVPLECAICDKKISSYSTDSIYVRAINNDTIYSWERKSGFLGYSPIEVHAYPIPRDLKASEYYTRHLEAYRDSLTTDTTYCKDVAEYLNSYSMVSFIEKVTKEAPYGFFKDWGWDDEYSSISFHFNYMNLNKRTIKYIDVYWKVTNDVGDLRKTGHFKGTGPLEQYESASWNWDYSSYYVAGDASNMDITKVIITYMNGQQQVLTGNQIKFD